MNGIEIFRLRVALPPHDRFLNALREIDAVNGAEARKFVCFEKHVHIVVALLVEDGRKVKQPFLASEAIEPYY